MKKAAIGSAVIVVYTDVFPYFCRLWRGAEWVAQYLPDEGHLLSGTLFSVILQHCRQYRW